MIDLELLKTVRPGSRTYWRRIFFSGGTTVQLWGGPESDLGLVSRFGKMEVKGNFSRYWLGEINFNGYIVKIRALTEPWSRVALDFEFEGVVHAVRMEYAIFKRNKAFFKFANRDWVAEYPKFVQDEIPRDEDKYVVFRNAAREVRLCIFPAEYYDSSILMAKTKPALDEEALKMLGDDSVAACLFLSVGLLGYL